MLFSRLAVDFYIISFFEKNRNTIRVGNSLDTHQARELVWPGVNINWLQRLSADDKKMSLADKEFLIFLAINCFTVTNSFYPQFVLVNQRTNPCCSMRKVV